MGFSNRCLKAEWGRGVPGYVASLCDGEATGRCHRSQKHQSLGCISLGAMCSWSSSTWLLPFGGGFSICETTREVCPRHCHPGTSERSCSRGGGGASVLGRPIGSNSVTIPLFALILLNPENRGNECYSYFLVNRGEVSFPGLPERKSLTFQQFLNPTLSIGILIMKTLPLFSMALS